MHTFPVYVLHHMVWRRRLRSYRPTIRNLPFILPTTAQSDLRQRYPFGGLTDKDIAHPFAHQEVRFQNHMRPAQPYDGQDVQAAYFQWADTQAE